MKFLLAIFLPLQLFAQDITGVWTGTLYNDTTKQFIKYELAISEYEGKLSGYSHTIFVIDNVENVGVKSVKVKKEGEDFNVEDNKLIYNNYTEPPAKGVKLYSELSLSQNDTAMVLSGHWKTNWTREFKGLTGKVFLQKKKKIQEALIIATLENLGLSRSLSFMSGQTVLTNQQVINTPLFNSHDAGKQGEEIAKDVAPNNAVPSNSGMQQADMELKADKKIPVGDLKKDSVVNKDMVKNIPLPVAKISTTANDPTKISSPGSPTQQISKEQKAGKNIPVKNLTGDSVVKNDIAKTASLPVAGISTGKNDPVTTDSLRSIAQQNNTPQKAGNKIPGEELKNDSGVNKAIVKNVAAPVTAVSTSKSDLVTKGSPGSIVQQNNTREKAADKIPVEKLKKDSIVNKDMPSPAAGSRKNEPATILLTNSTAQISKQPEVNKELPGKILTKNNSENIAMVRPVELPPAAEIATRKIEAIRSVDIKSDSLVLTLYDNGEIDGDTVSVLLNGKVIMPKEGLMATAINKTIYLTPEMGDSIVLIMYAESLGSIPPNTGLLVIHDGDDIYEIRFSGDLTKNSSIILKRKRKR